MSSLAKLSLILFRQKVSTPKTCKSLEHFGISVRFEYYISFLSIIKTTIMGKGQDAKKNVKKAPEKTAKEKRQEKRLKKSK